MNGKKEEKKWGENMIYSFYDVLEKFNKQQNIRMSGMSSTHNIFVSFLSEWNHVVIDFNQIIYMSLEKKLVGNLGFWRVLLSVEMPILLVWEW